MISGTDLNRLADLTVYGRDDEKIGKIVNIYQSTDGPEGTFVTVSTGLWGSHASFVPLDHAELEGDRVVVPYDKDLVKDAPRIEADEDLTAPEEDRLHEHYQEATDQVGSLTSHDDFGRDERADDDLGQREPRSDFGTQQGGPARPRLRRFVAADSRSTDDTYPAEQSTFGSDQGRSTDDTYPAEQSTFGSDQSRSTDDTYPAEQNTFGSDQGRGTGEDYSDQNYTDGRTQHRDPNEQAYPVR